MKQLTNYSSVRLISVPVRILKTDINRGKKCDKKQCPVGRAIARKLHPEKYSGSQFQIWGNAVSIYGKSDWQSFDTALPKKALKFIEAFDAGRKVEPINFKIKVPYDFFYETT